MNFVDHFHESRSNNGSIFLYKQGSLDHHLYHGEHLGASLEEEEKDCLDPWWLDFNWKLFFNLLPHQSLLCSTEEATTGESGRSRIGENCRYASFVMLRAGRLAHPLA